MKRLLGGLVALLLLIPLPSTAQEVPPCPEGFIHYMPFCLTPEDYQALVTPIPASVDPAAPYVALVAKYWPPELVPWALEIMECESGFNPWAKNRTSTAAGLFQFLRSTWDKGPAPALGLPSYASGAPYVAEWNIQAAAWLYQNWGGKSQWSCRSSL